MVGFEPARVSSANWARLSGMSISAAKVNPAIRRSGHTGSSVSLPRSRIYS